MSKEAPRYFPYGDPFKKGGAADGGERHFCGDTPNIEPWIITRNPNGDPSVDCPLVIPQNQIGQIIDAGDVEIIIRKKKNVRV